MAARAGAEVHFADYPWDDVQLDAYLSDSLCRKTISSGLFWQLLGAMKRTGSRDTYYGWNKDIPILLLSMLGQS